jgi:hypothetical protein
VFNQQASGILEYLRTTPEDTGPQKGFARSVGIEELAKELFYESVDSAKKIIRLHSTPARDRQVLAKEILDLHNTRDRVSKETLRKGSMKLLELIRRSKKGKSSSGIWSTLPKRTEKNWNTDDLFFTLVKGNSFLPVVGSPENFNRKALENSENDMKDDGGKNQKGPRDDNKRVSGISISAKRYWRIKERTSQRT